MQKQREVVRQLITRSLSDQISAKEGSSRNKRRRDRSGGAGGAGGERNDVPGKMKWTCVSIAKQSQECAVDVVVAVVAAAAAQMKKKT